MQLLRDARTEQSKHRAADKIAKMSQRKVSKQLFQMLFFIFFFCLNHVFWL